MPSRWEFVAKAREYLGTPYAFPGRSKGPRSSGVDCVGIMLGVSEDLCLLDLLGRPIRRDDYVGFSMYSNATTEFAPRFIRKDPSKILEADVLTLHFGRIPCHVAIVTRLNGEIAILQAYSSIGRVVEHVLDQKWKRRIDAAFSIPGVTS